ncbi:cellulase family glycosylhydrolase [Nonomuraea sp. H19]|uniref:cellulase family glycosylhydrolase n=1 Tax=Nonomuraea sp. H19 TaxID=3452206 RepID=UPI003F8CBF10
MPYLKAVSKAGVPGGRLVHGATEQDFVPRGSNYVRLAQPDGIHPYHATFEPGRYTSAETGRALETMAHDGYNTVRVFIDAGSVPDEEKGHPHGLGRGARHDEPLYGPYMDNVADFVRIATRHKIRVMFSLDHIGQNIFYYRMIGPWDSGEVPIEGRNIEFLNGEYLKAKSAYLRNFVAGLRDRVGSALLSTVLAYQLDNEAYLTGDTGPFNRTSGRVRTANGLTYDMSVPEDRQKAQDENFVSYANQMVDAIRSIDPRALVTMGTFTYGAVGKAGPAGLPADSPGDQRFPVRPQNLMKDSRLSFLDLHLYPVDQPGLNAPYELRRDLQTIEWDKGIRGPVIVGEFGAFKWMYNDLASAAYGMRDLQQKTCELGMRGWLFWTFDTHETEDQRRLFHLTDEGGMINGQLAPIVRPDPCAR